MNLLATILVSLTCSIGFFAHATFAERGSTSNLRVRPYPVVGYDREVQRRLSNENTRNEYTAEILLSWETDNYMTQDNADALADAAQTFITRHIPTGLSVSSTNIIALGILSVSTVGQTLDHTASPTLLWVNLQIQGLVLGETDDYSDDFNFTDIVERAIHANDDEFLRQVEPIVISEETDHDDDGSGNQAGLAVGVSLLAVAVLVFCVVAFRVVQKSRDNSSSNTSVSTKDRGKGKGKDDSANDSDDNHNCDQEDEQSVDEQSMYTTGTGLRESALPLPGLTRNGSLVAIQPSEAGDENGGNMHNSFLGSMWSFSMASDVGEFTDNCEFDNQSADDNPPPKTRYSIENVDEFNIGDNADPLQDISIIEDKSSEHSCSDDHNDSLQLSTSSSSSHRSGSSARSLPPPSPLEPTTSTDITNVHHNSGLDTSLGGHNRLSITDIDQFDNFVSQLDAPDKLKEEEEKRRRELCTV